MDDSFSRIRASVIEGRAQTPRYIQSQLMLLHDALLKRQPVLRQAIQQSTSYTSAEIDVELCLTLKVLKQEYESFDFSKAVDEEYSLARLKDHADRRVPIGCVYIIPSHHNRLYSTLQPLAAAIAAGNCVTIQLEKSKSEVDSLLTQVLSESLDRATVAVVSGKPNDQDFFTRHCVVVDSRSNPDAPGSARTLLAPPTRCVAVVDRTADIAHAAREVVRARFSFDGRSPYAPDLVLVNEFVFQNFCRAAAQFATTLLAGTVEPGFESDGKISPSTVRSEDSSIKEFQQAVGVATILSGSRGKILHIQKRDKSLLNRRVNEPALVLHSMRSLDDAINLINSGNDNRPHQAAYFFSSAATAKYLGQFIPSWISYTNSIPIELLVGPSAPVSSSRATSIQPRHPKQLFSYPSPAYISPMPEQQLLCDFLDSSSKESRRKIQEASSKPLTTIKQGSGAAIGFFEQGLIVGGVVGLTGLIGTVAVLASYAGPVLMRRLKR